MLSELFEVANSIRDVSFGLEAKAEILANPYSVWATTTP